MFPSSIVRAVRAFLFAFVADADVTPDVAISSDSPICDCSPPIVFLDGSSKDADSCRGVARGVEPENWTSVEFRFTFARR